MRDSTVVYDDGIQRITLDDLSRKSSHDLTPRSTTPMTAPKLHEHTSPARQSSGPRAATPDQFPRRGVFCMVAGMLAIVASIGKRSEIEQEQPNPAYDPSDTTSQPTRRVMVPIVDNAWPMAEVHLVETREGHKNYAHFRRAPEDFELGEVQERGGEIFNVPFDAIERADWSTLGPIIDARNGDAPKPPALWARRAGYLLNDEQNAEADAQEQQEAADKADIEYLGKQQEALDLEAQIEAERVAFVESAEKRRNDLALKLLADRPTREAAARAKEDEARRQLNAKLAESLEEEARR